MTRTVVLSRHSNCCSICFCLSSWLARLTTDYLRVGVRQIICKSDMCGRSSTCIHNKQVMETAEYCKYACLLVLTLNSHMPGPLRQSITGQTASTACAYALLVCNRHNRQADIHNTAVGAHNKTVPCQEAISPAKSVTSTAST